MANILIYSLNNIGKSMAGPAIRCWEFAKALSHRHQITLICPNKPDIEDPSFKIISKHDLNHQIAFLEADVLITQGLSPLMALRAKYYKVSVIIDAYDPLPLERLEQFKHDKPSTRKEKLFSSINYLMFNFQMADSIICANEKQRDLWIGFLLSKKLISPIRYDADSSLRNYIDVVPFGLSNEKPLKNGPGLRESYGLSPNDKILLWGGGVWNWFDPLSLIKAMKLLQKSNPEIKLIFMGIKNPEPTVPEMEMSRKAIELAEKLELKNQSVFFNHDWVPYHERQNNLLDAALGVSIHFDDLETRYAFRTRILDYIWAELPILSTEGDSFAELVEQNDLGVVVPYRNEQQIAKAIKEFLTDPSKCLIAKANLKNIQSDFYWTNVIKPIERMIEHFPKIKQQTSKQKSYFLISSHIIQQMKEKGVVKTIHALTMGTTRALKRKLLKS